MTQIGNKAKAEEADKENFQILTHRAEQQVNEFHGLKTRCDGIGMQLNRQGVLIQNMQDKLGQHAQQHAFITRKLEHNGGA